MLVEKGLSYHQSNYVINWIESYDSYHRIICYINHSREYYPRMEGGVGGRSEKRGKERKEFSFLSCASMLLLYYTLALVVLACYYVIEAGD